MKNNIDVIRAFVGEEIDGVTVENNFNNFQIIAGEQIKLTGLPEDMLLIPVENNTSLKPNIILLDEHDNYIVIRGNAYFVATDGKGNVTSLTNEQTEIILDWIIDGEYIDILNFEFEGRYEKNSIGNK